MKTYFLFKFMNYAKLVSANTPNKKLLLVYKIIKQYYNAIFRRKNRHIRLLEPTTLIDLYLSANNFKSGLLNLFLKKWFFLKL